MAHAGGLHLLVVGGGSAGRRHLRNLAALGHRVSVVDPQPARRAQAGAEVDLAGAHGDLPAALAGTADLDGALVCSPTRFHAEQALALLEAGLPTFVEKPLAMDAPEGRRVAAAFEGSRVPLVLGYTYRWWPPIRALRERLLAGAVGAPRHVTCTMSAHLADWHPWERYQDFYMASRELGGGALLDESHVVDLALWLFGRPTAAFGRVERISNLDIRSDDNVDAVLYFGDGLRVVVHLDLYGRPHDRSIVVRGEGGTLAWTFDPNRLRFGAGPAREWTDETFTLDRNEMFVGAARHFVEVVRGEAEPACTAQDGVAVLEVLDAIRASSGEGRVVGLDR